jgi:AcrR family transcriptional regulator
MDRARERRNLPTSLPMAASRQQTAAARVNRDAIVAAAATAIARRGVRGMRIEAVAEAAEVSPALLYYHFESRAGLVRAALEHASDQAPSTALRGAPATVSGANGYEALETALLGELDDDDSVREAAIVWGEVAASAVFDPELRDAVKKVTDDWRAEVASAIRAGVADGSISGRVDPDTAADVLVSVVDGLCSRWLSGAISSPSAQRVVREALDRTLRHPS